MSGRKARALRKLFDAQTRTDDGEPQITIKVGERYVTDRGEVVQVQDINRTFANPRTNHYRRAKRTSKGVAVRSLSKHYRANVSRAFLDEHILKVQADSQPKTFIDKVKMKVDAALLSRKLKAQHRRALRQAAKHTVR